MTWISDLKLRLSDIKGPTLYTSVVSALVLVAVHGLGWHLNSQTIMGFAAIVGSFIWNNGKFGYKAVHKANFWIAVAGGLLIILNKGLGWNVPMQYVDGAVALIVGVMFHNGNASAIIKQLNAQATKRNAAPAAVAPVPAQED